MILALAGRRIDAADAEERRFPLENADAVAERIRTRFEALRLTFLVCSGACGADLLALHGANSLGIRRRIVLPFDSTRFRTTSVVDRPANATWDWGAIFDEQIQEARGNHDLVIIPPAGDETAAYAATNERIFAEAIALSRVSADQENARTVHDQVRAIIVWEGRSRGDGDLTAAFAERARELGIPVEEIYTVDLT
jgi:hypothetical protein